MAETPLPVAVVPLGVILGSRQDHPDVVTGDLVGVGGSISKTAVRSRARSTPGGIPGSEVIFDRNSYPLPPTGRDIL